MLVCSTLNFMLIVQIYEILNKSLKSCQELNNKIRTRDVNLAIIYMKVIVEILNVVGIGKGDKKTTTTKRKNRISSMLGKTSFIRDRSLKRSQKVEKGENCISTIIFMEEVFVTIM